ALERVADRLGLSGPDRAVAAAEAALRIATAAMASEAARNLARQGEHARNYALLAFGGAGPTHAAHLAEESGMRTLLVPPTPSTFCALGAILSDVKRDFINSRVIALDDAVRLSDLHAIYEELRKQAAAWISTEGDLLGEISFEVT